MGMLTADTQRKYVVPTTRVFASVVNVNTCRVKVDIRLPGKGNSNSHDARPVYSNHLDD